MSDSITLCFDTNNRLAVRPDPADPARRLSPAPAADLPLRTQPAEFFTLPDPADNRRTLRVSFAQIAPPLSPSLAPSPLPSPLLFRSIEQLEAGPAALSPLLAALLPALEPHLIAIPYLHLGESDFIYKFRPEKERNTAIYAQDGISSALYQSQLCSALKALARRLERTAADPVPLDFGAVRYLVPSHFGFCLGVKNAIERAYETLAANPGRRVFMLSELIHNPFVNEDLLRRGLRYLQTDKGTPFTTDGRKASAALPPSPPLSLSLSADSAAPATPLLWDTLTPDDIVIIPAFGATDDDKRRLIRKGIALGESDATCMLVEKVWKAARSYGRDGYTIIIHGKHEHEETKATFANTRRHAPAVIVRDLAETRLLGEIIASRDPAFRATFYEKFAGKHTEDFDVARHLDRVAVVNQTTLLVNETREIIAWLRDLYAATFGPDIPGALPRVGRGGRTDTLCYATQVNQDALGRALQKPLDAAIVIGGKNSSNTWQLYRLCEQQLGPRAFFIQSERDIRSLAEVEHTVFATHQGANPAGGTEIRSLLPAGVPPHPSPGHPLRVLVTGGASCPDGLIQQVITRINSFMPPGALRPVEAVLADIEHLAAENPRRQPATAATLAG
ncbi:penicillin tolerance protein [Opitutaceae bacterium TAV1]|nr:penicillin tolerance protein [Opitutaceae bacterium TAV1]